MKKEFIVSDYRKQGTTCGFTLIELLITSVIIVVVIGAVFSFFIFNLKSYDHSEKTAIVQNDVRMASDFITKEIRNVDKISVVADVALPETINLVILQNKFPNVSSYSFLISKEGLKYVLSFTIRGTTLKTGNVFSIDSTVLLNNIRDDPSVLTPTSAAIYYNKP